MVLVASDESTEPVEPSKKPFYAPTFFVTPQHSAIARFCSASLTMRGDWFDVVFRFKSLVQRIGVVGSVTDEARRKFL